MELSTLILIFFGFLTIVSIICTIVLYPGLREMIDELHPDSKENFFNRAKSIFDIQHIEKRK
jgi:hypothetical protein